MSQGKKKGSEHQHSAVNSALPTPRQSPQRLRKEGAFETLAVAEVAAIDQRGNVPRPGELAVEEARDWVNYDEM